MPFSLHHIKGVHYQQDLWCWPPNCESTWHTHSISDTDVGRQDFEIPFLTLVLLRFPLLLSEASFLRFSILLLQVRKTGFVTTVPTALPATMSRWLQAQGCEKGLPALGCSWHVLPTSIFLPLVTFLCLLVSAFCIKSRYCSCFLQGSWPGSMLLSHYKKEKSWPLICFTLWWWVWGD